MYQPLQTFFDVVRYAMLSMKIIEDLLKEISAKKLERNGTHFPEQIKIRNDKTSR